MTPGRHLAELGLFLVIAAGPVPLALALAAPGKPRPGAPIARAVVAGLVGWWVLQTAVALGLGACGHLELGSVVLAELGLAGLGCLVAGRSALDAGARAPEGVRARGRVARLLVVTWWVVGLSVLLKVCAVPITESDSLSYHLPAMAEWYQSHAFVMPGGLRPVVAGFAFDWDALCALFLMPFGEDFVVALPNVLAWTTFSVSIYLIGLRLGARCTDALAAALLAATLPVTRDVLVTMHVDLPLAASFVAALWFAIDRDWTLFFAALALLVGTKMTGLVLGALLGAVAGTIALRDRGGTARSSEARGRGPVVVVLIGAASLLAAGFWYGKNLVDLGNPIGAVRVAIGPLTVFPGVVDPARLRGTTLLHQFNPRDPEHWSVVLDMLWKGGGLGVVLLGAAAAASLIETRPAERRAAWGFGALLVLTVAIYAITPFSSAWRFSPWVAVNFRYVLPSLGVLGVLAALGATRLRVREEAVACAVLIGAGRLVDRRFPIALVLVLVALGLSAATRRAGRPWQGAARAALALSVLVLVLAAGSFWLRRVHAAQRVPRYGAIAQFMEQRVGRTETIGYVLSHWKYVFYGSDLRRRVVHVPEAAGGREQWLESLRRLGVDLVAVGPVEPAEWATRPERPWLDDPDDPFARVLGGDPSREPVLYRVPPGLR